MNRELLRLLKLAGYPDADEPDLWQRTVMFNNRGAVPRPPHHDSDYVWRGFHLLMVDQRGTPTHFAKCRAADDSPLERECRVLEALGADPVLRRTIPQNRSACSEAIRLQVSRWLPGVTFERIAPNLEAAAWGAAVQTILERASLVSDRAAALLPDLLSPQPMIDPMAEATDHLTTLRREGIEPGLIDPITVALTGAPQLPRRLQHGDLWPGNIIRWDDDWWLLDFEVFGRVQVPLYDVFHLLRASPGRRANSSRWLGADDAPPCAWTDVSRAVLAHFIATLELTPAAVGGAYLSYLVEFTARMHSRGAPPRFRAPYIEELRLVAAELESGTPLDDLVPLTPPPAQEAVISER